MSKLLPLARSAVAFVGAHKTEIAAAGAFLSGVALPGPFSVVAHVAGYGLTYLAASKP